MQSRWFKANLQIQGEDLEKADVRFTRGENLRSRDHKAITGKLDSLRIGLCNKQ